MGCFGGGGTTVEAPKMSQEEKDLLGAGRESLDFGTEEARRIAGRYDATRPVLYDLLGFDFEEVPLSDTDSARKAEIEAELRAVVPGISQEQLSQAMSGGIGSFMENIANISSPEQTQRLSELKDELSELSRKEYKLSPQSQEEWNKLKGLASGEVELAELGQDTMKRIMNAGPGVLETALNEAILSGEAPKGSLEEMYGRLARESGGQFEEIMKGGAIRPYYERMQEQTEFEALKERYGKMGMDISGGTLSEATPTSTAGVLGLQPLQTKSAIQKDLSQRRAEELGLGRLLSLGDASRAFKGQRMGELFSGAGFEAQREGEKFARGSSFRGLPQRRLGLLGTVGEYGAGVPGQFANLAQTYGGLTQPYQYYSGLKYDANVQTAANKAQARSDWFGLLGTAGGMAGGAALMSSKTFKKNISKLSKKEEKSILDMVEKTGVYTFRYKKESPESKLHLGLIVEKSPDTIVTKDKKHLDVGNYLGLLMASNKALASKVNKLERRIT